MRDNPSGPGCELGLTLIELLIVIAVIGILAAIAIPQYFRYLEDAKAEVVVGNLKLAVDAVSLAYAAANNQVTTNVYNALNGDVVHNVANPVYGPGSSGYMVISPTNSQLAPVCGQVAMSASVVSAAGPRVITLLVGTNCNSGGMTTAISNACSAAGFARATSSGVSVYQNGAIVP